MTSRSIRRASALVTVAVTIGALLGTVAPGGAFVTSTTDQLVKVSPPADVTDNPTSCSANSVLTFDEQQGVTLGAPVKYQFKDPGTYDHSPKKGDWIPAGTVVDSHFLDSNRCNPTDPAIRVGTWTFSQDILGVIVGRQALDNSDVLGAPGTTYGGAYPSREIDFGNGAAADSLQIVDARTITVHLQTRSSTDQMRVLTAHNSEPAPTAGGPYAGVEGTPVALSASVLDPDGDPVTKSWSFAWAGSPGTSCTTTGTTTLSPSVTCNDDAVVAATLSVTDGFHSAVTSVATVNIGNVAPSITSVTVPVIPVALGSPVSLSALFTDAGSHDTHTGSIAWGDTAMTTASIDEGGHSVSGSHVYATPGGYPVTLTLNDDDGGTDSVTTAQIVVVGPPTASAGGPYTVDEGTPLTLAGSGSSSLSLTQSWVFTPGIADPGTSCSSVGTTTLSPILTCNDDVVVDGELTVSDGLNPSVMSSTTVAVTNVAPVLDPLVATAGPIAPGQPVTVSGAFTDAGTNDTHTSLIDWGDMTTSVGSVTEVPGSGLASAGHTYALPGTYTVSADVSDKDGGIATRTITIVVNAPPSADAGGPYVGVEGSPVTLGGTASDPNGDPLTKAWTFSVAGGPGTACTFAGTTTYSPSITCNDNATVTATLTVSDGINPSVSSSATVTVGNLSPTATGLVATPDLTNIGTSVSVATTFADPGTNDTHTATVAWGDGPPTTATVAESSGSGGVSASHTYTTPGMYTVTVVITDDDGGSVTVSTDVVVYDPTDDFVTANGNFASPSGAYTPGNPSDPNYTGNAHIEFLVRYGVPDPTGHGEFRFNAADLEMEATGFTQLVVGLSGTRADFRGTGEVNDVSGYEFLVTVVDGSPDLVRIKVWKTSDSSVVYDSQPGDPDTAAPTTPMTGSGVVIH